MAWHYEQQSVTWPFVVAADVIDFYTRLMAILDAAPSLERIPFEDDLSANLPSLTAIPSTSAVAQALGYATYRLNEPSSDAQPVYMLVGVGYLGSGTNANTIPVAGVGRTAPTSGTNRPANTVWFDGGRTLGSDTGMPTGVGLLALTDDSLGVHVACVGGTTSSYAYGCGIHLSWERVNGQPDQAASDPGVLFGVPAFAMSGTYAANYGALRFMPSPSIGSGNYALAPAPHYQPVALETYWIDAGFIPMVDSPDGAKIGVSRLLGWSPAQGPYVDPLIVCPAYNTTLADVDGLRYRSPWTRPNHSQYGVFGPIAAQSTGSGLAARWPVYALCEGPISNG